VNNTYIVGAGVGASSRATRRAKMLHSTVNTPTYPYNRMFNRLGLQASGGSNDYAYNWYFNDVWPNPYPIYRNVEKTLKYSLLPSLVTDYSSVAWDVSSDGSIIVGFSVDENNHTVAVKWFNGVIQKLNLLYGLDSGAYGCSSDGSIIVGVANDINQNLQAVKWVNSVITLLETDQSVYSSKANDCSPDGSIIVGFIIDNQFSYIACVWINNKLIKLPTLGGLTSEATGCSSDGSIIVGLSTDNPTTGQYAVKWIKNGDSYNSPIPLELLTDKSSSLALKCSDNGTNIVGYSTNYIYSKAVTWINNSINNLGSLTNNSGSIANSCSGDGNIIVGYSLGLLNSTTAVKWTNKSITSLGIPYGYDASTALNCSPDGSIIVGFLTSKSNQFTAIKWYYE
jgi:uncharacterized membrane protein